MELKNCWETNLKKVKKQTISGRASGMKALIIYKLKLERIKQKWVNTATWKTVLQVIDKAEKALNTK